MIVLSIVLVSNKHQHESTIDLSMPSPIWTSPTPPPSPSHPPIHEVFKRAKLLPHIRERGNIGLSVTDIEELEEPDIILAPSPHFPRKEREPREVWGNALDTLQDTPRARIQISVMMACFQPRAHFCTSCHSLDAPALLAKKSVVLWGPRSEVKRDGPGVPAAKKLLVQTLETELESPWRAAWDSRGPELPLNAQACTHISLWPHDEGVGENLNSADTPRCFLKLFLHPGTSGLKLAVPHPTPYCSSPTTFFGLLDGTWVHDRTTARRAERWGTTRKKGNMGRASSGLHRSFRLHHWLNGHDLSKLLERVEDGGAWCGAVHGVTRSQTQLSDWTTTATAGLDPCLLLRYAIHLLSYNFMFELHCAGVAEVSPQIPLFFQDCVYILRSFHSAEGPDRRSHALQALPRRPSSHLVVSFQPTQVLRRTSLIPGTKVL